jgi:hypothetical protein
MFYRSLFVAISSVLLGYAITYEVFTLVYGTNIFTWYTENKIGYVAVGYIITSNIRKSLNNILFD